MVGAKSLSQAVIGRFSQDVSTPLKKEGESKSEFLSALKSFLLVPLCPLLGYYLVDQTGISHAMVVQGLIPQEILGEGFGHVGLCFSIHYAFNGVQSLFKACQALLR